MSRAFTAQHRYARTCGATTPDERSRLARLAAQERAAQREAMARQRGFIDGRVQGWLDCLVVLLAAGAVIGWLLWRVM